MPSLMIYAIVVLVAVLLWAFLSFDKVIKIEYEEYHRQWLQDDEPVGFFWRPENSSGVSSRGKNKFVMSWLFKTPEWAESSQEVTQLLKRFRILVFAWNLGFILWLLLNVVFRPF